MTKKSKHTSKNKKRTWIEEIRHFVMHVYRIIDLRHDIDREGTIQSIDRYIDVKGYNVWILIGAAMIASIGLDLNSAAVIIGAMLVSPLMSPILGLGLSIGINDRMMFKRSLYNFAAAISVSILVSFIYFLITPLGDLTAELKARTSPTLLDVGVALFGGVVGIVASSHKDKTNALPGVAIATALMPPLCTVGFGLAKSVQSGIMHWGIWGGALYLFFINATIISFTTFAIVRFLDFPMTEHASRADQQKTTAMITTFAIIMVIPSIFILNYTLERISTNLAINRFIKEQVEVDQKRKIAKDWTFIKNDSLSSELTLHLVTGYFTTDSISMLERHLNTDKYDPLPKNIKIRLFQHRLSPEERSEINTELTTEMLQTIEVIENRVEDKFKAWEARQNALLKQQDSIPLHIIEQELNALFPEIETIGAGYKLNVVYDMVPADTIVTSHKSETLDSTKVDVSKLFKPVPRQVKVPYIEVAWKKSMRDKTVKDYEKRLQQFLNVRFNYDTIAVVRQASR